MKYIETVTTIEIPFYDVDSLNIVWHGNYVKYLEQARCTLFEKIGYTYVDMKNSGYIWPIATLKVKYILPCIFMQKICIKTTLVEYENRIRIKYVVTDEATGNIHSKAETVQIGVNLQTQESCFISPQILLNKVEHHSNE